MSKRSNIAIANWDILFPFTMATMIFGCYIQYVTGNFMAVSVASAITSACCAFLAFIQVKNLEVDYIRIQVYLSAVAYFFPLSYLPFIDSVGLLLSSDSQLVAGSIMVIVSISIGWFFSYWIRLEAKVPRDGQAFLRPIDIGLLVIPICVFQLLMMVTGKWSYATTHEDFLSYTAVPVSPLIIISSITVGVGPMVAYNYGLLKPGERSWMQAMMTLAVVALGSVFWLIEGRRSMSTFVLLSALAFMLARTKGRLSPKLIATMAIAFVILGLGLMQGSKIFYSMRLAREILGRERTMSMSITDFIDYSSKIKEQPIPADIKKAQAARPFVIDNLSMVLPYVNHHLYGKELAMQVITTIPSAFFPGKAQFTAEIGNMEDLWTKEYGVPLNDYANSFTLDGYLDFWYFGFLFYCVLAGLFVQLAYRLYSINPAMAYFCLFNNIALFLQVETSFNSYIGHLRNLALLFIPLWIGYAIVEASGQLSTSSRPRLRRRLTRPGRLAAPSLGPDGPK